MFDEATHGDFRVNARRLTLEVIFQAIGSDFAAIIHIHDKTNIENAEKSPIPYIYYATEITYIKSPPCAWVWLAATESIYDELMKMKPAHTEIRHHPFSIFLKPEIDVDFRFIHRPNLCFFSGHILGLGTIYHERKEVVQYIEQNCPQAKIYYPKNENGEVMDAQQYLINLHQCIIALNVPSIDGTNFRDIEAIASGAILLTKRHPNMLRIGLIDGITCRHFSSKEEALEIIQYYEKRGYDVELAKNAWQLLLGHWESYINNEKPYWRIKSLLKNEAGELTKIELLSYPENIPELKQLLTEYKTKQIIHKWKFTAYEKGSAGFEISILFTSESSLVTFLSAEKFKLQKWPAHTVPQRVSDIIELIHILSPLKKP